MIVIAYTSDFFLLLVQGPAGGIGARGAQGVAGDKVRPGLYNVL